MKKWPVLFMVFFIHTCFAQKNIDILKNTTYYTASSARWVSEIKITEDSLFILKKRGNYVEDEERYKIVGQEKKGEYFFVYTKTVSSARAIGNLSDEAKAQIIARSARFGTFVISFSKDKEQLFLLHLSKNQTSIEEVKNADINLHLEDKYFTNWYSASIFAVYTKYPELVNADKPTIQKVVNNWIDDLKKNGVKIHNTGNVPYQENLSQALIANHLNPLGTMTDLDNKLKEYHISLPAF